MLKKVISQKTSIPDLEYYNKSFTLKKSSQNSPKSNISNIPSNKYSIEDLSQICNKNTKSIFNKIKNKTNNKYYPFNSYKYKMKKSANFSNDNINNNISNNINNNINNESFNKDNNTFGRYEKKVTHDLINNNRFYENKKEFLGKKRDDNKI